MVQSGEPPVSSGAKLQGMPYARYLQHLGAMGCSVLEDCGLQADKLTDELALRNSGVAASIRPTLNAWQAHGYFVSPALQVQLLAAAGKLT